MQKDGAMATLQVRDVPDEVAKIISAKARAEHKSVSAYLRDLMAADVKRELQRRAIAEWNAKLAEVHADMNLTDESSISSADIVHEIRGEYDE